MVDNPERRTFLKLLSVGGGITLGKQVVTGDAQGSPALPHSRLVFEENAPDVVKQVDDGTRAVVGMAGDGESTAYDYVAQQVWNSETDSRSDVQYEKLDGGGVSFDNAASESEVSLVYARDRAGEWHYLFDLSAPSSVRTRLRDAIRDDESDSDSEYYERSFEDDGIRISWRPQQNADETVTITIPYSLYAKRRNESRGGTFDVFPKRSNNDFSQYVHRALTEALQSEVARVVEENGEESRRYRVAEVVSRFVQSIPHAIDRDSKGQLNYIRTPEESLAELTADCKDASLLMYHLLRSFEYDPKLVFLSGGVTEAKDGNEKQQKKSGRNVRDGVKDVNDNDLYPNHLAVVLPKGGLEPLPRDVQGSVPSIDHDGESYLYVESTSVHSPGVIPESHRDKRPIVY